MKWKIFDQAVVATGPEVEKRKRQGRLRLRRLHPRLRPPDEDEDEDPSLQGRPCRCDPRRSR